MKQGLFFTYKEKKLKNKNFSYFIYNRIKLKIDDYKDVKEDCAYWKKENLFPHYPIYLLLEKNKIIIFFYSKNDKAPYFEQNLINLPFDDEFLFTNRLKQLYNIKIEYEDYNITEQLFFSDYYPTENKSKGQIFYLRELLLDFIYEFFCKETFKYSEYYADIKKQLLKIRIIKYIYAKSKFYYYKNAEIYGTELYRKILDKWHSLLLDSQAEKIIHTSGEWFDQLNEEINTLAKEIFKQRKEENKQDKKQRKRIKKNTINLQQNILEWQIANFQLVEIFSININKKEKLIIKNIFKPQYYHLIILFSAAVSVFFAFILSNFFLALSIYSVLFFIGIAIDLYDKYSLTCLFKIISFEFFIISSVIWFSWGSSPEGVVFPYSISLLGLIIILIISFFAFYGLIKSRIKYISNLNTLILFTVSLIISFWLGVGILNINKDNILSTENQLNILQNNDKLILISDSINQLDNNKIYVFKNDTGNSIKIAGKIYFLTDKQMPKISLTDSNRIIPKNAYILYLSSKNFVMLNTDSLLYNYAQYTNTAILQTELKLIFLPRYLLFWTIISTSLGSFVYIWINSRVKANL